MGKFLNGVAVGVLATIIYQKKKASITQSVEKTPLQNFVHTTKQLKESINNLSTVTLPEALNTLEDIKQTVNKFTVNEQPRIKRVQHYISILKHKGTL